MSNKPIAPVDTPDPWVIQHNNLFYLTFTLGNRVEIWSSPYLEDFRSSQHTRKSTVWHPPPHHPWSADLWAPELHYLHGTWYIYFCAAPPQVGNPGHRTVLLRSNNHEDPMDVDAWKFLGPLKGMPEGQWSIDATVFSLPRTPSQPLSHNYSQPNKGEEEDLYLVYSGWPLGDHSDTQQDLFLIRLSHPDQAIPSTLTCISRATLPWERPEEGRRGVNEGPQFLSFPPTPNFPYGFQGIIYSAHGSWGPDYKLGILALVNPDQPCREESWIKRPVPLLISGDEKTGPPYGPGHACFLTQNHDSRSSSNSEGRSTAPAGTRVLCIYHGTENRTDGWNNRKARVLNLSIDVFRPDALPVCCATSMLGAEPGNDGRYSVVRPPTEQGPGPVNSSASPGTGGLADSLPVGHTTGTRGQQMWQQIERKVPDQYRGYLDRVKKFF